MKIKTTYSCDNCSFVTEDKKEILLHERENHYSNRGLDFELYIGNIKYLDGKIIAVKIDE